MHEICDKHIFKGKTISYFFNKIFVPFSGTSSGLIQSSTIEPKHLARFSIKMGLDKCILIVYKFYID